MAPTFPIDPAQIAAHCLCLHARRVARVLARRYDEAMAPLDLTNGQFSLLALLAGHREIGMQALAEALGMDRTTLTAAIKPLVRRGLLRAEVDALDARARRLQLTRDGVALLRRAMPLWQQAQDAATARVGSEDADRLRADLQQLL
jgi:DNA-binding MarR family transcriptional regulator